MTAMANCDAVVEIVGKHWFLRYAFDMVNLQLRASSAFLALVAVTV
jgi:hypothetical protein